MSSAFTVFGYTVCTLCSHSGELSACCCTAAQQKESTYPACLQEKLVGGKQLIWVPEDPEQNKESVLMGGLFCQKNKCSLLFSALIVQLLWIAFSILWANNYAIPCLGRDSKYAQLRKKCPSYSMDRNIFHVFSVHCIQPHQLSVIWAPASEQWPFNV